MIARACPTSERACSSPRSRSSIGMRALAYEAKGCRFESCRDRQRARSPTGRGAGPRCRRMLVQIQPRAPQVDIKMIACS